MRILKLMLLFAALVWTTAVRAGEASPTVDQIIDNYIEALGGAEAFDNVQNIVYRHGRYEEGHYVNDNASMSVGRPFYKLVGDKNDPGDFMEGYDGSSWEYFGAYQLVIRTVGAASAASRHYAGVERPLYNYRAKASSAECLGETEFDGKKTYVIKLIRRDGFEEQFYIDAETWLLDATSGAAPIHAFGPDVETFTRISDYRPVGGILVPARFETVEAGSGEVQNTMQWGEIEANVDLPPGWFSPPVVDAPPVTRLIEALYGQRSDFTAMIWTYEEFRLAYPDVDTNTALNIAGYQILKMGDVKNAIKLLERNLDDYPASADTLFGLGRAWQTAGDLEKAKAYYQQALDINPDYGRAKQALDKLDN